MNRLITRNIWAAIVVTLLTTSCASRSRIPEGLASGGIQTSQQMEFNMLILEQREQINVLREELLLHRRQIAKLMQQQHRR